MFKLKKVKWLAVFIVLALLMAFVPAIAGAGTEENPDIYPLYAGQNMEVGYIEVWDDGDNLYVNYVLNQDAIDEGWCITETHLHVGKELTDFPRAGRQLNPVPGQFAYSEPNDCDTEFLYEIPIDPAWGTTFKIAAHAVVFKEGSCEPGETGTDKYKSDETTMVTAGNVPEATYPYAAVPANAGSHYGANTWISQTGSGTWDPVPTWIWESMPVVNPIAGDIVWFEKAFEVVGTPTAGALKIACDNGYAVWLNGKFVGKSATLVQFVGADGDYDTSLLGNLKQPYVTTSGWQTVGNFDLTPYLLEGNNVLKILGVNEYMNTDDASDPVGTTLLNPGGLAYSFTVDWEMDDECTEDEYETAWAATAPGVSRFTNQGNWATYIAYTLED